MILGRFAQNPVSGVMIGHVRTLFYKSDKVCFEPLSPDNEKSPSHRIYTGDEIELGAAWKRAGKADGAVYYDVKLDDPTFAAPIFARLVQAANGSGFILIWDRRKAFAKAG